MGSVHADYVPLDEVKRFLGITDDSEDAELMQLIHEASRIIDRLARRRFYVPDDDETRLFDVPDGDTLVLDEDLYSLTSVTNGDGTNIPLTDILRFPPNDKPKERLKLKPTSGIVWRVSTKGEAEQVIQVQGRWGYMDRPDAGIQRAVKELIGQIVGRRGHEGVRTKRIGEYLVSFETLRTPEDLPGDIRMILGPYVKHTFA